MEQNDDFMASLIAFANRLPLPTKEDKIKFAQAVIDHPEQENSGVDLDRENSAAVNEEQGHEEKKS